MKLRMFGSFAVLAALGCHQPTASEDGVSFAVRASPTQVVVGQPDTVIGTLTNTTGSAVVLSGDPCEPRVVVKDPGGHAVVNQNNEVCILALSALRLAPGEQRTFLFVWSTDSLPPGTYSAYATFTMAPVKLVASPASVRLN